jgi:hypothetical protein
MLKDAKPKEKENNEIEMTRVVKNNDANSATNHPN